ncbi:MerR family transcriptional regulator [Paenibacillus qinlingensis]|uniref:DNA-binding transcriptional MerR regulator n=1 Tax=Paenibacillus qinlingensis TaxID=1837343 RepID=A0ABU1P715_9BACL|nr:MerR family transcriptional regulator [Paenibacillus qinlingensis]MDR6555349.1 DNA-binding transcriptional MerR regulator [Paenibacillus qinlingensis]
MDKYKIDDVAKESGLTKRTIRYYEEIGVLFPPERSEGGMRLYTRKHIERLSQIVNARDVLGFSLMEIQDFVAIREKLDEQKQVYWKTEAAEEKLSQLREIKVMVDQQMDMVDQKINKMIEFRKEIEHMQKRVNDGISKMTT